MSVFDVALMVATDDGDRPLVATVTEHTRVDELVAAAGAAPATALARHGERLHPTATLGDAGVRAGDTLRLGDEIVGDWKRLGPELRVIGGDGAGRRRRISEHPIVVGRSDAADLTLRSATVSRRHAEIEWTGTEFTVRDLGSRHGTVVDGVRLGPNESVTVVPHTAVQIGDSVLTVATGQEPFATSGQTSPFSIARAESPPRRSYSAFVVPSAGALALAAAASGAPALVTVTATPTALLAGILADRALSSRASRRVDAARAAEVARVAGDVRAAASQVALVRRAEYVDPATLHSVVDRGSFVWSCAPDALTVRVGLRDLDDAVPVVADDDAERALLRDAATARLVPLCVDLAKGPVHVLGAESFLDDLVVWLVVQSVCACGPDDLELVVVSDDVERWAWTALLPHARSRVVVRPAAAAGGLAPTELPRRLLVLDRSDATPGRDDLVIVRSESTRRPRHADGVAITAVAPARVAVSIDGAHHADVLADIVDDGASTALRFAVQLASFRHTHRARVSLPARLHLPDVVPSVTDAAAIARAWRRPPDALVAVFGADTEGPAAVRLAGASSHMLVAGTTGSGKTRLLETLVLGLAANYSPAELNVLTIDFKGGNELAGLSRLPHCVGAVSDRNAAEVDRAIAALSRELARRDEVFAAAQATDRADYVAKSGQTMPYLVVVADEFGQFRREDAAGSRVAALLRIAAQGRSKGVHLVLATQSPSIDVTADIRQNVGVRLCLRVTEAAESVAVLGGADAALLTQPGRVVVSDGNGQRVAQVALSRGPVSVAGRQHGVVVRDLVDVAAGRTPVPPELPTELFDTIVDTINIAASAEGLSAARLLGPSLPSRVQRSSLPGATAPWTASGFVLAERDRPGVPDPSPVAFDPYRHGSCTIVGGARSGRTTALLALAEAARAQTDAGHPVAVHAVDWTGGLAELAGAECDAGVVAPRDFDHLRRTLRWLAGDGVEGVTRLLLVDRYDLLLRDARELDGGQLATELTDVVQSGPRRRVFAAVSVDPASLISGAPQLGGLRLVLPVDDPTLATAAGLPRRNQANPGRAVALPDGDDVQVGRPQSPEPASAPVAGHVARMPTRVGLEGMGAAGETAVLGIGGNDLLGPVAVELDRSGPLFVVIGRAGSGKSTALDALAHTYRGHRSVVRVCAQSGNWSPDAEPSFVLVDDGPRAAGRHPWLAGGDLAETLRARGHVLVAAFDQADVQSLGYGHWLMRRPCPGLLLALDSTSDRIVAGERVGFHPPAELRAGSPGRGWWCDRGRGIAVQVAIS